MDLKGKTVIFLGDSITEGAAASSPDKIFHSVAARELELGKAVNAGIGGTRIARQQDRSDAYERAGNFNVRAQTLGEADLVVVLGGTNDFGHGDAPFGEMGDDTYDTFCGACRRLFAFLTEKYGRGRVAAVTPLHRADESIARRGKTLADYAAALGRIAREAGVPVLDMQENRVLDPNTAQGAPLFADGLHPTDAGHAVFGRAVAAFLRALPEPECGSVK